MRNAIGFLVLALGAATTFGQENNPQVAQLVRDAAKAFSDAPCEFEFHISANIFDPLRSVRSEGKGWLAGTDQCHAEITVMENDTPTRIEWFERENAAAAKVGNGSWQKVGNEPSRDAKELFHWLSPVQVFREINSTTSYFPEHSASRDDDKKLEVMLDLSPMLLQYYARFRLNQVDNDEKTPPRANVTVEIDNEKKRIMTIGYTVIVCQKRKPQKGQAGDWSWEDGDDNDHQGAMDHMTQQKAKRGPQDGQAGVNYSYLAQYEFKYATNPANSPRKPKAPKEVSDLIHW